jgi:hypothetical protein
VANAVAVARPIPLPFALSGPRKSREVNIAYRSGDYNCLARLAEAGARGVDSFVRVVVPFSCRGGERRLHFE